MSDVHSGGPVPAGVQAAVPEFEAELNRPTRQETCFRPPGNADRLGALRQLVRLHGRGAERPRGVNTHVHTGKSFGVFFSPAAACWQACKEGLDVFGINDHYTTAGHEEFRAACEILGLRATFSMEAIALDRRAQEEGRLLNDPDNPGRVYFTAKGVTRALDPGSKHAEALRRVVGALEARHRKMARGVARWLERAAAGREWMRPIRDFGWPEVISRTPHGNVTERHIAGAIADRLIAAASHDAGNAGAPREEGRAGQAPVKENELREACRAWFGEPPPSFEPGPFQDYVRRHLLKAGKPCFVEESADAYLSVEDMRDLFLGVGAIPTYPILGNPVTDGERDVDALLDRLGALGVLAFEVIPYRNTRERLREIVRACQQRQAPLFTGTEHNTLESKPLLDPLSRDPEFLPCFEASACVLLGHQEAAKREGPEAGFVGPDGKPRIEDARARFAHFEAVGRKV